MTTKQQQMAAYKAKQKSALIRVVGIDGLEIYVKPWQAKDYRDVVALAETFKSKHQDGLNNERMLALELVDADGKPYFDYQDREDLQFLADLSQSDRQLLDDAAKDALYGDYFTKKALQSESVKNS